MAFRNTAVYLVFYLLLSTQTDQLTAACIMLTSLCYYIYTYKHYSLIVLYIEVQYCCLQHCIYNYNNSQLLNKIAFNNVAMHSKV